MRILDCGRGKMQGQSNLHKSNKHRGSEQGGREFNPGKQHLS